MIRVEDDLVGGEDNQSGGTLKPWKGKKRRKGDRDAVGLLQSMLMTAESRRFMTAVVEDMTVANPVRVSLAELRNGGELEELQFRSRLYGLKILQGKNVLYDSLLF
jgi:hypothetical protein